MCCLQGSMGGSCEEAAGCSEAPASSANSPKYLIIYLYAALWGASVLQNQLVIALQPHTEPLRRELRQRWNTNNWSSDLRVAILVPSGPVA